MKLRSALLATAMMALPLAAANAQAVNGLYIGGGAGVNFIQRETFETPDDGVAWLDTASGALDERWSSSAIAPQPDPSTPAGGR